MGAEQKFSKKVVEPWRAASWITIASKPIKFPAQGTE